MTQLSEMRGFSFPQIYGLAGNPSGCYPFDADRATRGLPKEAIRYGLFAWFLFVALVRCVIVPLIGMQRSH